MAVFTHITHDELAMLLAHYNVGTLTSFSGIAQGIDNSNFTVTTTTGKYVLTIFEGRIDPRELPYYLGFMAHLATAGIYCPAPIPDKNEQTISSICNKPCTLFPFLDGRDTKPSDITPELCGELGLLLAKMHLAGAACPLKRTNSMGLSAWEHRITKVGSQARSIQPNLDDMLSTELTFLKHNWPSDLPGGNIHADLFPDNVFIRDGHIHGVIDFYFSATDFLAYDLAIVMNAWCFDADNHFDEHRWKALLTGYETIRPLTPPEKESYQILCRGAAMRFLSSRLHDLVFHDPKALVTPKPPTEYICKLEFHRATHLV